MDDVKGADFFCDLVVVGGGIAGQALASGLVEFPGLVLVIDSGPGRPEDNAVVVSKSSSPMDSVDSYRSFGIGGTSAIWGGNLVPFTNQELHNGSWPINVERIQGLIPRALHFLGFGRMSDQIANRWKSEFLDVSPGQVTVQQFYRLARKEKKITPSSLTPNRNTKYIEGLRCKHVEQSSDGSFLLHLRNGSNEPFTLSAGCVVLSAGTFESARILENSKMLNFQRDSLGKCFSPHVRGVVGVLSARGKPNLESTRVGDLIQQDYLHFAAEGKIGFSAWKVTFLELRNSLLELRFLGANIPRVAWLFVYGALRGYKTFMINVDGDQTPLASSQFRFLKSGVCEVEHRIDDHEMKSLQSMLQKLPSVLEEDSRIYQFKKPRKSFLGKSHHLGGLRMAEAQGGGVVDKNLEVFGVPGLFICSTGVFPTFSSANPTLLLVQLALNLSDFLVHRKNRTT